MTEFWASFLADTSATVVGVLVGLPLALWTNRKIAERGERQRHYEQDKRLAHALETVARALSHNRDRFAFLAGVLQETHATFDPALDFSAWEATRSEIAPLLHDAEMQHRLAYHFARVRSLSELHKDYLSYSIGTAGALAQSEATKSRLQHVLMNIQLELDADAEQLLERLQAARANLKVETAVIEQAPLRRAPAATGRFRVSSGGD